MTRPTTAPAACAPPLKAPRPGRRLKKVLALTSPVEAARAAGLRYVCDDRPGIRRLRAGKGFRYVGPDGKPVRDREALDRIRALAIPPAWTDVWICPLANGHLQATGLDARRRKQYRYHPRWREVRDGTKYDKMILFGQLLPLIRARVAEDMAKPGLSREKVLATVVRLLETTHIRVGNAEYARANGSYGLTTLQEKHVDVNGSTVHFEFRGKSGVEHAIDVRDRQLARIVKRLQDLPGQELFHYLDEEGNPHTIDSGDVNEYLHAIVGQDFTAKDFRTWAGTVLAAQALLGLEAFQSQTQAKRNVIQAITVVAQQLGNTKAVCRKCYIHPAILASYLDGSLCRSLEKSVEKEIPDPLPPEEAAVLAFLQSKS